MPLTLTFWTEVMAVNKILTFTAHNGYFCELRTWTVVLKFGRRINSLRHLKKCLNNLGIYLVTYLKTPLSGVRCLSFNKILFGKRSLQLKSKQWNQWEQQILDKIYKNALQSYS